MLADNEKTADDSFKKILHEKASFYPPLEGPKLPPWVAYDKKVIDIMLAKNFILNLNTVGFVFSCIF